MKKEHWGEIPGLVENVEKEKIEKENVEKRKRKYSYMEVFFSFFDVFLFDLFLFGVFHQTRNSFRLFTTSIYSTEWDINESKRKVSPRMVPSLATKGNNCTHSIKEICVLTQLDLMLNNKWNRIDWNKSSCEHIE